jgi:hypothetical protein
MTFLVKRYWEVCDAVRVTANDVATAIATAHELPLNHATAEYVPDSLNSDPETDVQELNPNMERKPDGR